MRPSRRLPTALLAGAAPVARTVAAAERAATGLAGPAHPAAAAPDPALAEAVRQMADVKDIRPPVPYGAPFPWALAAAGAALLVAAVLLFLWWRRCRRATAPAAPPVPPDETALAALAALGRDDEATDKVFYTGLSAVLRAYLEGRFGVDALERTTEELLPAVRRLAVPAEHRLALAELFAFADPVKYADVEAGEGRRRAHLAAAEAFVEGTREAGATVPGEAPAPDPQPQLGTG